MEPEEELLPDEDERSLTVTLHFNFWLPTFAVIVVVPAFFALTLPFLLTVATDALLLDQVIFCPLAFTTFRDAELPAVSERDDLDNLTRLMFRFSLIVSSPPSMKYR